MAKKGHFCTFMSGYLETLTYGKNLENEFVFRISLIFRNGNSIYNICCLFNGNRIFMGEEKKN